jgi:hypothetical protein
LQSDFAVSSRALIRQKLKTKAHSGSIIDRRDDALTAMKMTEICVPDEIRAVSLMGASLFGIAFRFSCHSPKIVLLKDLLDISNTDWTKMFILEKPRGCMYLFHSPLEKALSQLDDGKSSFGISKY